MTARFTSRLVPPDLAELPPLLTVRDLCRLLAVRDRSVRRWISGGRLRCVRAGGRVRVFRRDLAAFLGAK